MRPGSGEGCRREEGKGGDGWGVRSVGKGKIKPSQQHPSETLKISSVLINSWTFLGLLQLFFTAVAALALSSVPSVFCFGLIFLPKGTQTWTRQLL